MLRLSVLRQLEIDYAGNIAGGESRMVRSLCYDMGHVFEDEEELASCIADMRAIGEGAVTEVLPESSFGPAFLSCLGGVACLRQVVVQKCGTHRFADRLFCRCGRCNSPL